MAEESKNLTEAKSEGVTSEKVTKIEVDLSGIQETLKASVNEIRNEMKKEIDALKESMKQPPAKIEAEKKDTTKGLVVEQKVETKKEGSMVVERAEFGKGLQIWRDYAKENPGKFKRFAR